MSQAKIDLDSSSSWGSGPHSLNILSGNATPSATGNAAILSLQAKNWTIT